MNGPPRDCARGSPDDDGGSKFAIPAKKRFGDEDTLWRLLAVAGILLQPAADVAGGVDGIAPVLGGGGPAAVGDQEEQGGHRDTFLCLYNCLKLVHLPISCPITQPHLPNFHQSKQNRVDRQTIQCHVN